jgi:hypothetical protein
VKLKIASTRTIDIDLQAFRDRVNIKGLYTNLERESLLKTYDLFEQGKFVEAIKVIKDMPDEWEGYVDEVIYDSLRDFQDGAEITIIES